jgi:hypothetical protein
MSHYRVIYQPSHVDPRTQMEYLGEYILLRDEKIIAVSDDMEGIYDVVDEELCHLWANES